MIFKKKKKNYIVLHDCTRYSFHILLKLKFSRQNFENPYIRFHENPSSRSQVVPCGRTDRHDEANNHISLFLERAWKVLQRNRLEGVYRLYVVQRRVHCALFSERPRNYYHTFFIVYSDYFPGQFRNSAFKLCHIFLSIPLELPQLIEFGFHSGGPSTPVFWEWNLRSWVLRNVGSRSPSDAASLPGTRGSSTYAGLSLQKWGLAWPRAKLLSRMDKTPVLNSGLEGSGCEFLRIYRRISGQHRPVQLPFWTYSVHCTVRSDYVIPTTAKKTLHFAAYVCMFVYVCIMYVCVWMYVCKYVWMYACMYVCMYVCVYELRIMYVCMNVCMHVCMYVYMNVRIMYVCMYVCMYVYMYVCMYECMHACMYVCMYVYMYVCIYVCMYECMHACMYVYMNVRIMYVCMYACMYVCMCVCACVWIYVCMYVSMCVYECMYICMYVCVCVCMYVCMCVCIWMYVFTYVCMYVCICMNACIYICMCVCMYLYMYVCMYVGLHICNTRDSELPSRPSWHQLQKHKAQLAMLLSAVCLNGLSCSQSSLLKLTYGRGAVHSWLAF